MIQVNLLPDVKQELITAQRQRNTVVSIAVIAAIAGVAAVVLLAVYVFGVQTVRGSFADNSITSESKKLKEVKDLDKSLTVQHQLESIKNIHNETPVNSRLFDVLTTITPTTGENAVSISNFTVNTEDKTITIEGQAARGFVALEAFKKTILATKFEYNTADDTNRQSVVLTEQVSDGSRSYGEDSGGKQVLRFSISFVYPDELLSRASLNGRVIAPQQSNVTDSRLDIPDSLFTAPAGRGQ